jgi:hypothetical protein
MSNAFEVIQKQRKEMNLLQREMELEERNLHVLELNYKDTCRSKIGKENSRSISYQLNLWIKNMEHKEKLSNLLFVSLEKSFNKFKEYIFDKYSSNNKKRIEFKKLFSNKNYVDDCIRIMKHKIYDFKTEESIKTIENGFVSPAANRIALKMHYQKKLRSFYHESINSSYKTVSNYSFPENATIDDLERIVDKIVNKVANKKLDKIFKIEDKRLEKEDNLLN